MKKYSLTSPSFAGEVIFCFNDTGAIELFDATNAVLSEEQVIYILKNFPLTRSQLDKLQTPHASITEVTEPITFADFWNRYDEKKLSDKKRAEIKWNRMLMAERVKAYKYIPKYLRELPSETRKKYAETYLNAELWNN